MFHNSRKTIGVFLERSASEFQNRLCQGIITGAKELGYNPYVICGRVPGSRDHAADGYTRHGWVMINGKHYDAEGAFAGWGGCFGTSDFTTAYQVQKIVRFKY